MFKCCLFWLGNSRLFSLPMTIMSWIIVFLYSLKFEGNVFNGILALIGISMAHLATNLFDDYVDYKTLSKDKSFMKNTVKTKCAYIKEGKATLNQLLRVVIIYCSIAFVIGVYLTFKCGWGVALLALIGGLITLTYAKLSSNGFSEIAVGIAFGPLLFEGVYYVMCGSFSLEVLILSVAVVVFTIGLLYTHNLLDYDGDVLSGKKTLSIRLGSKSIAAAGLLVLYFLGYFMCLILAFLTKHFFYLIPLITVPLVLLLYQSVRSYFEDKNTVPRIRWWNYPLEGWDKIKQENTESFYIRLYLARNIMVYFSVLMIIAVLFR